MSKSKLETDETFTEAEQRKRDGLLLKLLKTAPDAKRPKRERASQPKSEKTLPPETR